MSRHLRGAWCALGLILLTPSLPALADAAADALLVRSAPSRTPRNAVQNLTMTVKDTKGKTQIRKMKVETRVDGPKVATRVEVTEPADVAGTRFLSRIEPGNAPELYLYLPTLNRTSKMLAKRAALLGSDFSPADLDFSGWEKAEHTVVGRESIDAGAGPVLCDVVESVYPTASAGDYTRARLYLAVEDGFPRRIDLMEADKSVVKRWRIIEVGKSGAVMYPRRSVMETLAKGTSTELVIDGVRYDIPLSELPEARFTPEGLKDVKQP